MSKSSQAGLVTIRRAAEILDCGVSTLRTWDREGKLAAVRTPGGQRRYRIEDIERFQGINRKTAPKSEAVAIYCRVSSHEQKAKGDLDRQKARLLEHCVKKRYTVTQVLDEVGSGMTDTRPKMLKLFDLAVRGEIGRVIIDHKDRLTRFNFNVFKAFLASHGVLVEWLEDVLPKSYEAELVEDMVSLMSSFSARVYGKRSAENRRKKVCKSTRSIGGVTLECFRPGFWISTDHRFCVVHMMVGTSSHQWELYETADRARCEPDNPDWWAHNMLDYNMSLGGLTAALQKANTP